MKKLLCALIAAVMMLTMVCPVMAVDVGNSDVSNLFTKLETMMPNDAMERIAVWNIFKPYMVDGTNGIDTIIKAVKGQITLPATDAGFKDFIDNLQNESQATRDGFIFLLNVYKAVPVAKRSASLNLFGGAGDSITTEIVMNKLQNMTTEQLTAANAIYDRYVPQSIRDKFAGEHHYTDPVTSEVETLDVDNFLLLLTAFKGQFKMTDSGNGDFALATYDETFATNLASYIDATNVNGVSVSTSPNAKAEGYDIICGIVKFFNSFTEDIENLKVVLRHTDIDLYGPSMTIATRPTTGQQGGSILGGGGGGLPPKEDDKPVEPDVPAVKFPDIVGHWAEDVIRDLEARGILTGYDDGNFKPDIGVTRQEIAVIMTRALDLEEKAAEYADKDTGFADDQNVAAWGRGAINLMVEMGIYTGYDDNEFKPNKTILRQELIAVVMRYAAMTEEGMKAVFDDSHEIHGYAESFIAHASELGIVNGYPDGTFKPMNNVTRAEAAKIIYGVIDYYKEIGKLN